MTRFWFYIPGQTTCIRVPQKLHVGADTVVQHTNQPIVPASHTACVPAAALMIQLPAYGLGKHLRMVPRLWAP